MHLRPSARFATALLLLAIGTPGIRATTFRGIAKDQGTNLLSRPVLDRTTPWYIDIEDNFTSYTAETFAGSTVTRGTGSQLIDTYADQHRIGFVPPFAGVPDGPLTGEAAALMGRWMGSTSYRLTDHGSVARQSADGVALTCIPWRVVPGLGNAYLIDLEVDLAAGESATVGYFGDLNVHGTTDSLSDSGLGQLAFRVTRGNGVDSQQYDWQVSWWEGSQQETTTGTFFLDITAPLRLELGWADGIINGYDAWISTDVASFRVWEETIASPIDVHGIGFELSGTESEVTSFLSAVPEPTNPIACLGSVLILVGLARRDS